MPTIARTESQLVRACLEYLAAKGIMAWRNNTGALVSEHKGRTRFIRYGAKGSGDIFAILPGGRFLSIECKAPKGRLSLAQEVWQFEVARAGGLATVVRDVNSLDRVVRDAIEQRRRQTEGGR